MPHEKLQEMLKIDYESDMALVVLGGSTQESEMIAIAHYLREPRTNFAEAAFLVRDDRQGRGIGTALMNAMTEIARQQGTAGFTADVLAANHGMLRVFHKCGYGVESHLLQGMYNLRIPFETRPTPA